MNLHPIPVTVKAGAAIFQATLDVEANYCPAEPDAGLPAGWEIENIKLPVCAKLRGRLVATIRIRVDTREPVYIEVDPEALAKLDVIDIDDDDLREQINYYLQREKP